MPHLALLVLAAQVGGATSGAVPSPAARTPVRGRPGHGVRPRGPPRDMTFSSRETLDLLLRPRVRQDLQGDHLMQLKVFTPGGFLYQVITLPFVGAAPPARGQGAAAPRPGPCRASRGRSRCSGSCPRPAAPPPAPSTSSARACPWRAPRSP